MKNYIKVFNLGNLPTAPLDSFNELQEDFKKSDPDKLSKLQMLIITRGFKYSFKVWKDNEGKLWIIDAHQRRKALLALRNYGFEIPDIPYEEIQASNKKEAVEEIAAYNSEFAQKNPDTLLFNKYNITSDDLGKFNLGYEVKKTDFSIGGDKLFSPESEITEIQEDGADFTSIDGNVDVFSQPGDIYLLGNNRLMCGDCRSTKDVQALMNGRLADMILTDPPYNVNYEGGNDDKMTIQNDSMENDLFFRFLKSVFDVMYKVVKPGGSYYVFHADSEGENFRRAIREAGFKIAQCCIWVKDNFVMGRQDYQWKHEPCLYGWKKGAAHYWNSDRKQTTIWNFDKPKANRIHPTMKPIALMAYPITNSTKNGELIVDFFSGSGSTIMACQQTDRIGYGMEIDPKYVTATVRRFMGMFPQQGIQLIRNGKLLSEEETKAIILCQK
ncbi:DNA (cytosine-5-)-methyltransferase [Prevotella disiens FB035-09AN]|uniref:Methyltransferase n=1 Tax=Prevotella disiens FB035-09AN TaxID=866771 RepID=E1KNZ1_9BACT|nr:site-specific DNA-methyltransferase [Prevotella disiens]EFL46786.1 DNA (cytosine-5-)-methyltransferase [Prevotella disiens FB035-09AN]